MKIENSEQKGLDHTYKIVVAAAEVDSQLQAQLESVGQKAKIPGFRPGKIPMTVLKQRYGKEVMDEVLWNSINAATRKLVEEKQVRPAVKPEVSIKSYEDGGDLEFELQLQVMPDVPELDYDKITISEYEFDIPEKEIEEGLARLAESRKHFHKADDKHKAALGDAVKIDFLGKLDGEPFEGGKGEGFQLELGSGQFIPGFEEQLIGQKAGDETVVKVTFPEQYHSTAMAGKDAEFEVKVHEVLTAHSPEMDDAMAKEFGFDDVAALKEAVKGQIEGDYTNLARNKSKKELFDWLDANVKFEIPSKMKELEFNGVWEQMQQAKAQGDPSLDKPEAELRKEYEEVSERRVRLGILLAEIGRKNNVQVGKDELTRAVMNQAQMFPGQEQKVFEFYQKNPEHVDELRGPIIEDKAVDLILEKVKRETKKVTPDELSADDAATDMAKAQPKKKAAAKKKPAAKKADAKAEDKPAKKPAAKKAAPAKKKKAD